MNITIIILLALVLVTQIVSTFIFIESACKRMDRYIQTVEKMHTVDSTLIERLNEKVQIISDISKNNNEIIDNIQSSYKTFYESYKTMAAAYLTITKQHTQLLECWKSVEERYSDCYDQMKDCKDRLDQMQKAIELEIKARAHDILAAMPDSDANDLKCTLDSEENKS